MSDINYETITSENEVWVKHWFSLSGFAGEKLDVQHGKQGKKPDWKFTKDNLTLMCEVKTIFSGGKSGGNQYDYERYLAEQEQKLRKNLAHLPEDQRKRIVQEQLDVIKKKIPIKKSVIKESEHQEFLKRIKQALQNNDNLKNLPFSVSITVTHLFAAYGKAEKALLDWLEEMILYVSNSNQISFPFDKIFTYFQKIETLGGDQERRIPVYVTLWHLVEDSTLEVEFLEMGASSNDEAVATEIEKAIQQLRAAKSIDASALPVIGLWTPSFHLNFSQLMFNDSIAEQFGEPVERYHLYDWVFSDDRYKDVNLAAIMLFELRSEMLNHQGILIPNLEKPPNPFCYVIVNQFLDESKRELFEMMITEQCHFITGFESDPLI